MAKEPVSAADAVPFVEQMQAALPTLLVTLLALLDALRASVGLTRVLVTLGEALLDALAELTEALRTRTYAHERIAQLTGVVWRSVDALRHAPLTERDAAMRVWHEHTASAQDAHRELKEAIADAQEAGDDGEEEEEEEEDDDEDALFDARVRLSDLPTVQRAVALLQLAAFALLQLERALSAPTLWAQMEAATSLASLCDELASACYAPLDSSVAGAHYRALRTAVQALLAAAQSESVLSDAQRTLLSGIDAKLTALPSELV